MSGVLDEQRRTELIDKLGALADYALLGCPAQTYASMTTCVEALIKSAPLLGAEFTISLNECIKALLEAQKIDDLTAIYDIAKFEIPSLLRSY